jgi:hypothetical protein
MRPNRYLYTSAGFIGDSLGQDGDDGACAKMAST